jgi:hypothetical protein
MVTPVKIPAAAGKAHEEPSKTVGPAGDSLYQSQREEKKLMVDSEASYTFSNTALFFGLIFTFLKTFPFMCDLLLWSFVRLIFVITGYSI